MLSFWGLTLFPEKTYTQTVESSFKLSMAALDETTKPGRSSVRVTVDNKTFVLCSLISGKVEQQNLDLVFTEGEEITFSVSGDNTVHLSGNFLPEDQDMDFDSDEYDDEDGEDFDGDASDDEEDEEEQEEAVIVTKGAKRVAQAEKAVPVKKVKVEEPKKVAEAPKKAEAKKEVAKKEAAKKVEDKKEAPKKAEAKKETPKKEAPKKEENNKKVLANGLVIEDVKVGTGAPAKSGKKIGMRYIGRLTTGKVFDKNTSGKPFNFNLGRGEVIKGWDLGIQGMMLGGERKLTIPPALAYGAQGAPPDIPRNATLVFEVKLISLN